MRAVHNVTSFLRPVIRLGLWFGVGEIDDSVLRAYGIMVCCTFRRMPALLSSSCATVGRTVPACSMEFDRTRDDACRTVSFILPQKNENFF